MTGRTSCWKRCMRTLGVDYGERRIGFAVSDAEGMMAFPLHVTEVNGGRREAMAAIQQAREETEAERIVIGIPINMDGTCGPMADKVTALVLELKRVGSVPVETWDERLSTCAAERVLLEADMSRMKRRRVRDKVAAQIILQAYLDSNP